MNTLTIKRHTQRILASAILGAFILSAAPSTVAQVFKAKGLRADASPQTSSRLLLEKEDIRQPYPSPEDLAALTIYLEARGESFAGKMAVAAVIRNRMAMKYQSDGTIKGTVLKRKQFQPWNRQQPLQVLANFNKRRMEDSLLAWRLVQDGRNVVDGAVLFYNPRIARTPRWAEVGQKVATIGEHEFYVPRRHQT
jgi:N-acetylmuramoyl-L-alanine amidase